MCRNEAKGCPPCLFFRGSSAVCFCAPEYLGQCKQLLLGKCGLYSRSGTGLFAHGQMTKGIVHCRFWQVYLTMAYTCSIFTLMLFK